MPLHLKYVRRLFLDVLSPRQLDVPAAVSDSVPENLVGGHGHGGGQCGASACRTAPPSETA
ncbi:hypothetical protein OHA27_10495 [Streptomyces sp. NBC_01619]|uniref:Uncharacterized protein n=1 Tax=Streptomyces pratisoli TaxID=3139917 RepID=A0ACC6QCJ0_9ACTN|nr:hypothetical protein [Streptomyces sp. NBC_01619]MCX4510723.1 hypothetical protein [Streptomyces sp. NBC_01619]